MEQHTGAPDTAGAEVDYRRTASLLRATLESTHDGVLVVDLAGRIQTFNRRFFELWHLPPLRLPVEDSSARRHRQAIVREQVKDPVGFVERVRQVLERPREESFDVIELKDGRVFERYSRPQTVDDKVVGRVWSFHDVTEQKRAEQRLRESEERFRLIAENVGDLVAMIDTEGRRLYNSPSYRTVFGGAMEPGTDSFREIHPEDRERIQEVFRETVRTGIGERAEFRFLLDGGEVRHIESEGRVIREPDGRVKCVVVVSRDITERKSAEQRLAMEHGVTRVLAECDTLAEAIPRIIETIARSLAWDCAARWVMDAAGEAIRCADTWSRDAAIEPFVEVTRATVFAAGTRSLVRRVWVSGEPLWMSDVTQEKDFVRAPAAVASGVHGGFAFPVRAGTVTLGVLEFLARDRRAPDESLLEMARVIGSQIGQFMARKQAEQNLLYVATHDSLTGLPNRYMFNQRFAHALNHAQRYGRHMAVLFVDLDRFKYINDTRGHPFGDALLAELGQRLRDALRDSDTVARFGGDEFVALIEEVATPGDVASVAQKVLDVIRRPMEVEGETCSVSASIGVSLYPDDGLDQATLLKNADIAVYRAKHQGRDNYAFHSPDMNADLVQRIAVEGSLKTALEHEEFLLHYQPRVAIDSGRVTGLEALIRWRHPTLGMVSPIQFIGQAEESGHIVPIGNWALGQACLDARQFLDAHGGPLSVSVNLSARQFEDTHLMRVVERALEESGLAPERLELEITESMMMRDPVAALKTLTEMKAMGIRLALDDFGTGYSSLASIKQFPFDCIKIDLSFVKDIPQNPDDAALARAIIGMGHSLRLVVVAEGVERPEQLRWLMDHRCDEYQGYLFRKPAPADEMLDVLRSEPGGRVGG